MILEGEVVLFSAAFLMHQGYFSPGYILLTIMGGIFVGDLLWYVRRGPPTTRPSFLLLPGPVERPYHHAVLLRASLLRLPLKRVE